jgi:type VII secretion protein EccB
MASRSDQLHSHQFTLQRVVGALAMRDPDPVSSPMRRIGGALFASVMIAVLAVAAVGVYGLLRPGGGSTWRNGNAMIIEKETGARYVFLDNTLYPVLNYTSALLILGSHQPPVQVARAQLVGVPRGTPLGINGAPDPLPGPQQLVTEPWTICSRPPASQSGAAASGTESVLRVGTAPAADALGTRGVLATDPNGGLHMLWKNRRYAVTNTTGVLAALAWSQASAVALPAALLNAVPAAGDLGGFRVPRSNRASGVAGYQLGDVVVVENQTGEKQFGVMVEDGLADITPVQAGLLLADGASGGTARTMTQLEYGKATRSTQSLVPTGDNAPPETAPEQVRPPAQGGICASFSSGGPTPVLSLATAVPPAPGEIRAQHMPGDPGTGVDWVAVPPGRGAVVESLASPGAPVGALAVVSDLGLRFAVPSREVLDVLGYGAVTPQRLPAALIALVPSGRALDRAAAAMPASV